MKKITSLLLALALIGGALVFTSVPASAADGMWDVFCGSGQYYDDYESEQLSPVAGYEYTTEGFHTISPDWTEYTPRVQVQSKNTVSLKDGVYMEVRVDGYTWDSGDRWLNFNLWDQLHLAPGSTDPKYGSGGQTLIRFKADDESTDENESMNVSSIHWYTENFTSVGGVTATEETDMIDADGKAHFILEVSWSETAKSYSVNINGLEAPGSFIDYLNDKFGTNDQAYVGFIMHHVTKAGEQELTILKYGTSKETATTPRGDDSRAPKNEDKIEYPMLDPTLVPEGEPAIFMNGDRENSDTGSKPGGNATVVTVNEDYSVHAVATAGLSTASVSFSVKDEVCYDIKDFPVIMWLTRNLCTCDDPEDCWALEGAGMYMSAGDNIMMDDAHRIPDLDSGWDPIKIEDGDMQGTYLYFFVDMGAEDFRFPNLKEDIEIEGEFSSARLDVREIKNEAGRNSFDVMFCALFRTVEDAENYIYSYLGIEQETEAPVDDETEAPDDSGDATEAPDDGDATEAPDDGDATEAPDDGDATEAPDDGDATEAPDDGDATEAPDDNDATEAPNGDATEAPDGDDATEAGTKAPTPSDKGDEAEAGCGAVIGSGAVVIFAALASCGVVFFKKKK